MIESITLNNFRGFSAQSFDLDNKTLIYGKNGKGKSSILEALSLFSYAHTKQDTSQFVKKGEDFFRISLNLSSGEVLALYYDLESNKKKYSITSKEVSLRKVSQTLGPVIMFDPMTMNLLYQAPSHRREFLDTVLSLIDPRYKTILREYKTAITQRNKLLKAIQEGKATTDMLDFWESQITGRAQRIYSFRFLFTDYINDNAEIFLDNTIDSESIIYKYDTKLESADIEGEMKKYFLANRQRDIIIAKTSIGPHIDDFHFENSSGNELIKYASRGEIKTLLMQLLLLTSRFIQSQQNLRPTFLIDDLFSELDEAHRELLLQNFDNNQTIISSIEDIPNIHKKILLD